MKNLKLLAILLVVLLCTACGSNSGMPVANTTTELITEATTINEATETVTDAETVVVTTSEQIISVSNIPEYSGEAYITLNNNQPEFTSDEIASEPCEIARCIPISAAA